MVMQMRMILNTICQMGNSQRFRSDANTSAAFTDPQVTQAADQLTSHRFARLLGTDPSQSMVVLRTR